jgi:hypothetical protein
MSQCPFCKKTVYFAERQMGPDGKDWHKACVIKHIQTKGREGSVFESYPQDKKPAVAGTFPTGHGRFASFKLTFFGVLYRCERCHKPKKVCLWSCS